MCACLNQLQVPLNVFLDKYTLKNPDLVVHQISIFGSIFLLKLMGNKLIHGFTGDEILEL